MSMTIYLHKYTGDSRNLSKWTYSATSPDTSKSIDIYNMTSVLTPQAVLDYDINVITNGYNYAYISAFNRYYYITDIKVDSGKRIILTLAVDVLNTYREQILSSPANVIRWEGARNSQIYDSQYPLSTSAKWYVQMDGDDVLASPVDGYHFVLGVNSIQ